MSDSHESELVLIVDDSPDTLEMLQRKLTAAGYRSLVAPGVAEAVRILEETRVDLVITDLKMPKVSGLDLVKHIRENIKDTEVMMITGYATINGAVEAVKAGAVEYLTKPFTDEELLIAVVRALERLQMRRMTNDRSPDDLQSKYGIIGGSAVMRQVLDAVSKAATTAATVLLAGESGTGKELVARAIHYCGPRASAPFVPINCGGIPEGLLESELFGYVKGAFTGATETRAGFFQTADGGTLFLDEISETSLSMQVKLLRVLQDGEIFMVGSTRSRKVNMRVIAATNKDLLLLVDKGGFREDLYYRLNVIEISIPPLRKRCDDVLLLVRHFAERFAADSDRPVPDFSDKAWAALRGYSWPGNVRELENVIQRLMVMTDGDVIDVTDLPPLMRFTSLVSPSLDRTLDEVVNEYIRNVLASVEGNKTRAAEILGIDRKTLREKLKKPNQTGA